MRRTNETILLYCALASSCLLTSAAAAVATVGAAANPTGNPIGGGPGYTRIVDRSKAKFLVSTATQLTSAISSASSGDVIYLEEWATVKISGCPNYVVPAGVTLASGRGRDGSRGALVVTDCAKYSSYIFTAGGEDVRFTGFRLRGPDPDYGDRGQGQKSRESGVQGQPGSGIDITKPGCEVDNMEVSGFGVSCVHAGCPTGGGGVPLCAVRHSYLHHCRRVGLGYGVHVNGEGSTTSYRFDINISANVLGPCKHVITASGIGHQSYRAAYNVALRANSFTFDRHGSKDPGTWMGGDAGDYTIVHHNTLKYKDTGGIHLRGVPTVKNGGQFYNNWLPHSSESNGGITIFDRNRTDTFTVSGNTYGGMSSVPPGNEVPDAKISVSSDAGRAPFTVQFKAVVTGFTRFEWEFGDQKEGYGSLVTHTYDKVGTYTAKLTAWHVSGVPVYAYQKVVAYPEDGKYFLSAWVQDSYRGARSGFYTKYLMLDGKSVWSSDVVGNKGWEHVLVDVTTAVQGKTSVTVLFQTKTTTAMTSPSTQIIELFVYLDQVYLFGADGIKGEFEAGVDGWKAAQGDGWNGFGQTSSINAAGADYSYQFVARLGKTSPAGSWVAVSKTATVGEANYSAFIDTVTSFSSASSASIPISSTGPTSTSSSGNLIPSSASPLSSGTMSGASSSAAPGPVAPTNLVDTRLKESEPDTAFSTMTYLDVGSLAAGKTMRTLLKWDIPVNPDLQVVKATLSLLWFFPEDRRAANTIVEVYRPGSSWNDTDATWKSGDAQTKWTTPGGDYYDLEGRLLGTVPFGVPLAFPKNYVASGEYVDFDVTNLVQAYIDGEYPNNGFLLKAKDEGSVNNYVAFSSSEGEDGIPSLVVTVKAKDRQVGASVGAAAPLSLVVIVSSLLLLVRA